jgi:SAM-dependent methyltransferase
MRERPTIFKRFLTRIIGRLQEFKKIKYKLLYQKKIYSVETSSHLNSVDPNIDFQAIDSFALDKDSPVTLFNEPSHERVPITWGHSDLTYNKYIGLVLRKNQVLKIDQIFIFRNTSLRLSFAPAFKRDICLVYVLKVNLVGLENSKIPLIDAYCSVNNAFNSEWSNFLIDLQSFDGKSGFLSISLDVFCPNLECKADQIPDSPVILSKITVGSKDQLNLLEARTFHETRVKNEIRHFSEVYKHKMYKSNDIHEQDITIHHLKDYYQSKRSKSEIQFRMKTSSPHENESVYAYASRLLEINLGQEVIDFADRLLNLSQTRTPIRVLSLCAGSARTEAGFDEYTNRACFWTLQDISEDLLRRAQSYFSRMSSVEYVVGDLNNIRYLERKWDIIMCVSGLHHVVELEAVIEFIAQSLTNDGEFWLIGEYVGMNGNRLNPTAQIEADKVFSSLPKKFRFNHHTKEFDSTIPRNDYSIDCFEGIRAEEIERVISRRFATKLITKNNSFLWRLVNLAYADNYELNNKDDLKIIEELVRAEILHFRKNHDGTTLNAVYTRF